MNNPYVKTLEPVWKDTKEVRINEGKLQELIKAMRQKKENGELGIPAWGTPNVQPPMDCELEDWINFVCWTNAINFAFTNFTPPYNKFTIEYPKGIQWRGSFALGASFARALHDKIPIFDAEIMSTITLAEINFIFRPIDDEHKIPMLQKRWKIIREAADDLLIWYDGQWINLFKDAGWRAFGHGKDFNYEQGIVEKLVMNFPSFRDTREYGGRILLFHKRAQLLVMEYYSRAFHSEGRFPLIGDIEDIGPIYDYELPKVFEFSGILKYSEMMKSRIEKRDIFSITDPMEIENRLATAYVMKKICDEVGINMAQADYYIWEMGRKSSAPHILVPTTDY